MSNIMIEKIKQLKLKSRIAGKSELVAIDLELERIAVENPTLFADAMIELANRSIIDVDEMILREKLNYVLPIISVAYLSKNYFKKTPQWFYQRLNGNTVNGREAHFTNSELKILSQALAEIGHKLSKCASIVL